jgi:hypothetical protein
MRRRVAIAAAIAALAGCTTMPQPAPEPPAEPPPMVADRPINENWRAVALSEDVGKVDRHLEAWQEGLETARARGFARAISASGPLLDPLVAEPRPTPPPGPYRCRVTRFSTVPGRRALTVYPSYFCHIVAEGPLLIFTKQDGMERPGGYLFDDGDARLIFLGALALGDEPMPPSYGQFRGRDLIGVVERIGAMRYRIAMPWPRQGVALDVIEMVPIVPELD